MHRTAIISGTLATLLLTLIVLMLAVGFSVDLTQALSQAAPILLATGVAFGLSSILLKSELA
jgi:TRAP-type C4-dicarboxylate transport system permease large subunit